MKTIFHSLVIILLCTISVANAQTTINITNFTNPVFNGTAKPPTTAQKLPVKLIFDNTFTGQKISFYQSPLNTQLVDEGTFGTDYNHVNGGTTYEINFKTNATTDPNINGTNTIIASGAFYFTLNNGPVFYGPFILSGMTSMVAGGNAPVNSVPGPATPQKPSNTDYKPGYIVSDALKLRELLDVDSNTFLNLKLAILKKYGITDNKKLNDNLFLKDYSGKFFGTTGLEQKQKQLGNGVQSNIAGSSLSSVVSSIGGLDVTTIADGLAKFIVKRTKEELSIAFFQKFKQDLDSFKDLQAVFPTTYSLLLAIDDQIYDYSNYISNLREAFRADINNLDENLPKLVDINVDFFNRKNNFELGLALRTGCYVSSSLKHDVHPADILANYPLYYFDDTAAQNNAKLTAVKGAFESLQLLSEALKESDTSKHAYWVNAATLRQLISDKDALKIYIGLVLQTSLIKYNKVRFNDVENFYDLLNQPKIVAAFNADYTPYQRYISGFANKAAELDKMINNYQAQSSDSLKVEQYAKYFKTTVQFIEYCTQVTTLPCFSNDSGKAKDLLKNTKTYFDIAYEVTDLSTAINRKRYPEAVNDLVIIYNTVINIPAVKERTETKAALAKQAAAPSADHTTNNSTTDTHTTVTVAATVTVNKSGDNTKDSKTVLTSFAKYGAFAANMVNAQNSNDAESAIEAAALPVGSAAVKRHSNFNVAVNAYCGLFIGNESIKGVDPDKPFSRLNSYGVTAPIGISISKGNRILPYPLSQLFKAKGFSSTWFISVFDLGAVAAFRFTNDTTAQIPSIQLKDLFSPGLFWSVGFPNSPISANIGAQVGPNLRNVTSATNDYSNNLYIRYSFSICVDLPLLNIYTK